jgi:bzd-type benzoyl-CoA reductase Q subunit
MDQVEKKEFWRWEEYRWKNQDIPDGRGGLVTAGVDIGSTSSQAAIMVDGQLFAYANMRTGSSSPNSAVMVMEWAMDDTGLTLQDLACTIGTGYGRVNVPFADKTMTEITCHARGAHFIYGPTVRTILDMGGQDCKAIRCDENSKVVSFLLNDKCAAGTGRGLEVMAELMAVPIGEVGPRSLSADEEPPPVSSICVVFAKTEALGLMRVGWSKEKVLAAYCSAMAIRVVRLLERNGLEKDFAITGGIAKNPGVVKRIEKRIGMAALAPLYDTQIAGAVGGALIAKDRVQKE